MVKVQTLLSFSKKKDTKNDEHSISMPDQSSVPPISLGEKQGQTSRAMDDCENIQLQRPSNCPRLEVELVEMEKVQLHDFDIRNLERDPGKRPQIFEYPVDKRDEVRRAYLAYGS